MQVNLFTLRVYENTIYSITDLSIHLEWMLDLEETYCGEGYGEYKYEYCYVNGSVIHCKKNYEEKPYTLTLQQIITKNLDLLARLLDPNFS
jgi:hypothetical protein